MLSSYSPPVKPGIELPVLPHPRQIALQEGLRVWAEIDLDNVVANAGALKRCAGEARLLAVVKGNAYGHGAVPVARAALEGGAWGLGVVSLEEGEELRRAGIEAPVLVLGSTTPALARRLVAAGLRVTVASLDMGRALSAAALAQGSSVAVHVKVETGLNRFGVLPEEAVRLAHSLRALPGIVVEGLSTHLASVDEGDKTFTLQQHEAFRRCADLLPWVPLHHVASTGGLLDMPDMRLAMVRTGIGLYGYYPSDEVNHEVPLRPVLSLRSRVARVATIQPGESVGYGRSFVATRPSRIALVMAGYGDGIRRALSNRGVALVRGCRAPYAGRVAMDMLMLDVTDIPDVAEDDEVTLIGSQGEQTLDADELARLCDTISYEVLTGVMARVPRLFLRAGRIVARQDGEGLHEAPS
jgi:alanine racemase